MLSVYPPYKTALCSERTRSLEKNFAAAQRQDRVRRSFCLCNTSSDVGDLRRYPPCETDQRREETIMMLLLKAGLLEPTREEDCLSFSACDRRPILCPPRCRCCTTYIYLRIPSNPAIQLRPEGSRTKGSARSYMTKPCPPPHPAQERRN